VRLALQNADSSIFFFSKALWCVVDCHTTHALNHRCPIACTRLPATFRGWWYKSFRVGYSPWGELGFKWARTPRNIIRVVFLEASTAAFRHSIDRSKVACELSSYLLQPHHTQNPLSRSSLRRIRAPQNAKSTPMNVVKQIVIFKRNLPTIKRAAGSWILMILLNLVRKVCQICI